MPPAARHNPRSRAQRDRLNAEVMADDKRLAGMMDSKSLPFDARRMMWWTTPAPGIECAKG